jgi:hypothetical protein
VNATETCNIQSLNTITSDTFGLTLGGKLSIARFQLDCILSYYYGTGPVGGEIMFEGRTDNIRIYTGSLMAINARGLMTNFALVENSSKSDVSIFVNTKLDYSIRGTGNIYLYGNPADVVAGELISTGRLIRQ